MAFLIVCEKNCHKKTSLLTVTAELHNASRCREKNINQSMNIKESGAVLSMLKVRHKS